MNTQTHLIVASAFLTRPARTRDNVAVLTGALIPDLSIYVLFLWARAFEGIPERTLWRVTYWEQPWQLISAIGNSIPIYVLLVIIGLALGVRVVWMFALAALTHLSLDLPFHADDAHRHIWPISDWRFHSPLSYWDNRYNGEVISLLEIGLALSGIVALWLRFSDWWVRGLLLFAATMYLTVPAYFHVMLG